MNVNSSVSCTMAIPITMRTRLRLILLITTFFFVIEISVGFYAHSLALIADAFHYLNDLLEYVISLTALELAESTQPPPSWLPFGWQRAQILGAFFNGVFLFALGVSTILQSIEKFIFMNNDVTHPKAVLIVAGVGLVLNICSVILIHDHGGHHCKSHDTRPKHKHTHDLGSLGVLVHLIGDALNNISVMISALIIWLAKGNARFYADPAVSIAIACMILMTSVPLARSSARILLQSLPMTVNLDEVETHLKAIPGVVAIHDLRIWSLNEHKTIASVHALIDSQANMSDISIIMKEIDQYFHALGVEHVTVQPEFVQTPDMIVE